MHAWQVQPIDARPLLDLPLSDIFDMPEGVDAGTREVLARISERVAEFGPRSWGVTHYTGETHFGVEAPGWAFTTMALGPAAEVDFLLQSSQPKNWRGGPAQRLWRVRLTVGVDCECPRDHGASTQS